MAWGCLACSLGQFSKDIYQGFTSMQEIFLLSMLIGGLGALMERRGSHG